jgi:hypothetical protein
MLTLGAVACTFDHGGILPGSPDADVADAPIGDAKDGAPIGSDAGDADPSSDGASDDSDPTSNDDATIDSPARPDSPAPTDAKPATDTNPSLDGASDAGSSPDARFDCAAVPGGTTFTPPGSANAHCYWVHSGTNNWLGAVTVCAAERGHLVTVGSNAETTFLLGLAAPFSINDRIWIGATDGRFSSDGPGSGPFVWITGEPMTYMNWASAGSGQQPDGLCKSCSGTPCECEHRADMMSDGRWEDLYEALYHRYVCEAEL